MTEAHKDPGQRIVETVDAVFGGPDTGGAHSPFGLQLQRERYERHSGSEVTYYRFSLASGLRPGDLAVHAPFHGMALRLNRSVYRSVLGLYVVQPEDQESTAVLPVWRRVTLPLDGFETFDLTARLEPPEAEYAADVVERPHLMGKVALQLAQLTEVEEAAYRVMLADFEKVNAEFRKEANRLDEAEQLTFFPFDDAGGDILLR